jgi:hypothetical protein
MSSINRTLNDIADDVIQRLVISANTELRQYPGIVVDELFVVRNAGIKASPDAKQLAYFKIHTAELEKFAKYSQYNSTKVALSEKELVKMIRVRLNGLKARKKRITIKRYGSASLGLSNLKIKYVEIGQSPRYLEIRIPARMQSGDPDDPGPRRTPHPPGAPIPGDEDDPGPRILVHERRT